MKARVLMKLDDRATLNAAPLYLAEIYEGGEGYVTFREVGQVHAPVGKAVDLERAVLYARAVLENSPEALAYRDGRRILAMALLGLHATATLRINEEGREVADVARPA